MSVKVLPKMCATEAGEQPVAQPMARPVGRLFAVDAHRNDHVQPVAQQALDHRRRTRRIVGGVAVDQHIDVGIDVGEHAPHHAPLALARLSAHHRAGDAATSAVRSLELLS